MRSSEALMADRQAASGSAAASAESCQQSETAALYGGVDRSPRRSRWSGPIIYMLGAISVGVGLSEWIAFHDSGPRTLARWAGTNWSFERGWRTALLFVLASLYELRAAGTMLVWLKRTILWSEALQVGTALALYFPVATAAGAFRTPGRPFGALDVGSFLVALLGFALTLLAELQRYNFKKNPDNKGRLFTRGLFSVVQHPNYTGDTLLFTGWALLTAEYALLALPALMATAFVFVHSPGLRKYLAEHYPDEYPDYSERTKKLVPFLY